MDNFPKNSPESYNPYAIDDISQQIYQPNGFIEHVRLANLALAEGDDFDDEFDDELDDDEEDFDDYSQGGSLENDPDNDNDAEKPDFLYDLEDKLGTRFKMSRPINVIAAGFSYQDYLNDDSVEPQIINRSDLYLEEIDYLDTAAGTKIVLNMVSNIDEYEKSEQFAILADSILHFSSDLLIDGPEEFSAQLEDMNHTLNSSTFHKMVSVERQDILTEQLKEITEGLIYKYGNHMIEVECDKYYELPDNHVFKKPGINWSEIKMTSDTKELPETYYLEGEIIDVTFPEFLDVHDLDRGFKDQKSFPVSHGVPHLVMRSKAIDYDNSTENGYTYFIPLNRIPRMKYAD